MLRIVLGRLALSLPLLLLVTGLVFVLQTFLPGDVAYFLAGMEAPKEQVQQIRAELHLDDPIWVQYGRWLWAAAQGDLGRSLINGEPVAQALGTRLAVTLSLVGLMTLLSSLIGVLLGVVAATARPWLRTLVDVVSVLGLAVPNFWLGLLLIAVFSVGLGWLPANGYVPLLQNPLGWFWSLCLPVLTLACWAVTSVAKQTRDGMLDALGRDFIRNLRANGLPERSILFRHALRNAALPVLTVAGLIFVSAVSSSVIVEKVFSLPGLGTLAVNATAANDIPMLQGVTLYFTLMVIVVNLLIDLAYGWLNPQVRRGG